MQQVKDFTDDTQFIIITHSQRTMGMTDEIWGVTQQVPGISTIHSLSFNAMEQFGDNPQHAADSREKDQESAASA
jgi:Chromosome segregation ATPases